MSDPNLNVLWCRCIAEELARAGVARVVACPGSRNSPLLFALLAAFPDRLWTHWDERGAGFCALGAAKALRAPVAVCVTSGTAAANLLPAACEAAAAGVPLILITADRPWEAQGCAAPQTMLQRGLFTTCADAVEIGEPLAEDAVLRLLRARVARAVQGARRPVHLNVPLRDPLPPLPDPRWQAPELSTEALHGRGGARFVAVDAQRISADVTPAAAWLRPGLRGLIVAGSAEAVASELVGELAATTGFPVLADAASGLRRPGVPQVIAGFDACVDAAPQRAPAELVIRIGPPPLTRAAFTWLGRQRCPQLVLGGDSDSDFLATAAMHWPHPTTELVRAIGQRCHRGDPAWLAQWNAAETAAQTARAAIVATQGWSEPAIHDAACAADGFELLWLASSTPVRHANLHLMPRTQAQRVLANRGLNGIDGTIAAFIGACHATSMRGLCLIGDLACLHDLNSLALAGGVRGAIVIVNNGGGAIFDALPVAQVAAYRRLVRADHDWDFAHAAAQFKVGYHRCTELPALRAALAEAAVATGPLVIECAMGSNDGVAAHQAVLAAMRTASATMR